MRGFESDSKGRRLEGRQRVPGGSGIAVACSALTMAVKVLQLRAAAGTPKSRSKAPRWLMTFIWRRYTPKTKRPSLANTFSSHSPLEGKHLGVGGAERGRLDKTLTNRTMSGRMGWSG